MIPRRSERKEQKKKAGQKKESEKARGVKQACSVILKVKKEIRVGES